MRFELTILGCGSAVPTLKRNCTAQVLNVLERYFLIDCGEGTQNQMRRFGVPYNKINNIFISHLHGDHFFGLIGFLSSLSMQNRRAAMNIYADSRLKEILDFTFSKLNSRISYPLIYHDLNRDVSDIYEDNSVKVTSFPLKHRYEAPCNGFLFQEKERQLTIIKEKIDEYNIPLSFIKNIKNGEDLILNDGNIIPNSELTLPPIKPRSYAYMTDTLFREKFADYVKGVSLLYHEATYGSENEKLAKSMYHSTATQAAQMALLCGAKKLIIGHFSARYQDPMVLQEEARLLFKESYACTDGDVFSIPPIKRSNL